MTIKKKLLGSVLFISLTLALVVALTFTSFESLSGGFNQVVAKAELGVTNPQPAKAG